MVLLRIMYHHTIASIHKFCGDMSDNLFIMPSPPCVRNVNTRPLKDALTRAAAKVSQSESSDAQSVILSFGCSHHKLLGFIRPWGTNTSNHALPYQSFTSSYN